MLNDRWGLVANQTMFPGFVIDMEKGVVVDSRALNEEQFTKYYRTQTFRSRPDLNPRQSMEFNWYYKLGQQILMTKASQLNAQIFRLIKTCTKTYLQNHFEQIFGRSYAFAVYSQYKSRGYVRTDIQREKIAKYGQKRLNNAVNLGLLMTPFKNEADKIKKVESITEQLRQRYVPGYKKKAHASAQKLSAAVTQQ